MSLLFLFSSLFSAQAVPLQITQQGRILDASGVAVTGSYPLHFRIYDAPIGGNLIWDDEIVTTFTNGYYASILGTDEINNPLDSDKLSQYPLYLELELDTNGPMLVRQEITSAPYAQMAGEAEFAEVADSVDGGSVNASEISVNGSPVIDGSGNWVGNPIGSASIPWTDIDANTIPVGLDDGDDDSLADISCGAGELLGFGSSGWTCVSDNSLELTDLENLLGANAVDLNPSTTIGGEAILTSVEDADSLGALSCVNDGEIPRYDLVLEEWYCDTDIDTYLDEPTVEGYITNGALDFAANSQVGGSNILTESSALDWSNLGATIPADLSPHNYLIPQTHFENWFSSNSS